MRIPVLIERVPGNGFRARGSDPWNLCGEGATRDEAVAELRSQCELKIRDGAEWIAVDVDSEPHSWLEFAGMFKGDPGISEWKESIKEYRRQADSESASQ